MNKQTPLKKEYEICFVALPYATASLHIGRILGSFLPADIYHRYVKKFQNKQSYLLSGLDCYGTNVYLESLKSSTTPSNLCLNKEKVFFKTLKDLSIEPYFKFRTNTQSHHRFVKKYLDSLLDQKLSTSDIECYYCKTCELYLADRFLENLEGVSYEKLVEGKNSLKKLRCIFCKVQPVLKTKKNFVLTYEDLSKKYPIYNDFVETLDLKETEKQVGRFFTKWGVFGSEKSRKILEEPYSYYVWIEALLSYPEQYMRVFKKVKKLPTKVSYFYGKDNFYYHNIVYPQLLCSSYDVINPCEDQNNFFKRNFVLGGGPNKMSASEGNVLTIQELKKNYDILRFALACLDPLKKDTIITKELIEEKIKLFHNKYQNLVKRVAGIVKARKKQKIALPFDLGPYHYAMSNSNLVKALEVVFKIQKKVSFFIDTLIKSKKPITEDHVNYLYSSTFLILNLLSPFTPKTSLSLKKLLK